MSNSLLPINRKNRTGYNRASSRSITRSLTQKSAAKATYTSTSDRASSRALIRGGLDDEKTETSSQKDGCGEQ
ncbi:Putative protein without homology [Lacticaseibacillus rhamnosus Lc 705]|nr:Putative protein without homology [Lacticaseibacillus rhamnosus Lc 705]